MFAGRLIDSCDLLRAAYEPGLITCLRGYGLNLDFYNDLIDLPVFCRKFYFQQPMYDSQWWPTMPWGNPIVKKEIPMTPIQSKMAIGVLPIFLKRLLHPLYTQMDAPMAMPYCN